MAANEIEKALSLQAKVSRTAGEPRKTPTGIPLDGLNRETYCSFELSKGDDLRLAADIAQWNRRLMEKRAFFEVFAKSGGRMEYFLGLFLEGNSGIDLPPDEMELMRQLGITLSLDIYP